MTINTAGDTKMLTEYYKQLYVYIFDNSGEMDQFLKNYELPNFIQDDISNLNNHTTMKEIL